jgi:carbohydrate-selective porin OprB
MPVHEGLSTMVVFWRAASAGALICSSGSTRAQERSTTTTKTAEGSRAQTADRSFDDRTGPRAAEETSAFDLTAVYTAEILGNARGGANRGARYLDNLDVTLTVDAERAFGWRGATLLAYGLYNNGEPFSGDLVGAAQGVSNIETGVRAARLYEAWIEQRFALDRASVKSASMTSTPSSTRSRRRRCSSIRRTASVQTSPSRAATGRRSFRSPRLGFAANTSRLSTG